MQHQALNLQNKPKLVDELWSPTIIAEMNDNQLRLVRVEGDFVWHDHADTDTDETFIVLNSSLRIDFRDAHVGVNPGEIYVVPAGVEHRPCAASEVSMLLIEPRGVVNTGVVGGELTAAGDQWI